MRVFVSEYLTEQPMPARALPWDSTPSFDSLITEGAAMLAAVAADFQRIDGVEVHSILGSTAAAELWPQASRQARGRLAHVAHFSKTDQQHQPHGVPVVWHRLHNCDEVEPLFEKLTADSDATLVIAPELSGLLTRRCRIAEQFGNRLLGPSSTAVDACADKLALCRRLQAVGVPTIDTFEFDIAQPAADLPFPVVIKPRDGCGSLATFVFHNRMHLTWQLPMLRKDHALLLRTAVWQPFVAGQALSVGVLMAVESDRGAEVLPVCEQVLSGDGRLQYLGGRVPAATDRVAEVQQIALAACEQVPGLRGYVGVDMLLPDDPRSPPLVVEINPRLTTSYLGYQALCLDNLAERMLHPDRAPAPWRWRDHRIGFAPVGSLPAEMD